jgi:hypothetical protein
MYGLVACHSETMSAAPGRVLLASLDVPDGYPTRFQPVYSCMFTELEGK